MPQAPWVLDAAYTSDSAQGSLSGPPSPQRSRRAPAVLHLDLRGVSTGAAGKGSPPQAVAQWKPANTFKSLGMSDINSPGSPQPYPALLLSVLSNGQAGHVPHAAPNSMCARSGTASTNAAAAAAVGYARGPSQSPIDAGTLGRNNRQQAQQAHPGSRPAQSAFTSTRMTTASAAASAAAVAAPAPRPYTYNPLLPRQGTASAGRRRPSTEPCPPGLSSPGSPGYVPPPVGPSGHRTSSTSGFSPTLPQASAGGTADHFPRRPTAPNLQLQHQQLQQQQGLMAHGQQYVPAVPLYSSHPDDSAAVAGRSHGGGAVGSARTAFAHSTEPPSMQGQGQGLGPAPVRGRSRFEPGDNSAPRTPTDPDQRQHSVGAAPPGLAVMGVGTAAPPGQRDGAGRPAPRPRPQHPPPARAFSPSPGVTSSAGSATEDSAFDYFGLYEGDVLSGEDEAGGEEEGEEDSGSEGSGGSSNEGVRPSRGGSVRGVRSTASVHAARRAAAAAAGGPGRPPVAGQQQRQPSPWSLQRPPSGSSGRPPALPLPPTGPGQPRRSSHDANAGAACGYGCPSGASAGSREGSASEAGSHPATASSAWSGYEMLLPPDAKLPSGPSRKGGSAPPTSGSQLSGTLGGSVGVGKTADASRRRAASNPRDALTLEARRGGGGGGSPGLSRCSSAASSRGGAGSIEERATAQALALLATFALAPPTSPGGASTSSAGSARRRAPLTARSRKGGSGIAPHRPLHPAVLGLTDLSASPHDQKATDQVPMDAKGRPFPYVLPPVYPGTCPTIAFVGTAAEKHGRGLQPLLNPTLLVKYGGVANTPVRTAFRDAGLRPTRKGKRWIVQWGGILDAPSFAKLHIFQRVNHFPGTWELGHKGHLYRNVYNARRRARSPAADAFDIVPRFYIMPRDYEEFRSDSERFPDRLYIQKPTNSSRGRGIRMVTRPDAIARDAKDMLVQHYIANPLLLNGFKFDMRVYAAATCLDPLRLYVFPDGLARLATEPYSSDRADLSKRCVHLTNYSVNKKSNKFVKQQQASGEPDGAPSPGAPQSYSSVPVDASKECEGSKWSLSGLRAHLEARGLGPGWGAVWRQVCDIVAAAVIAAEPRMNTEFKMKVPHRNNCFEVWGFDIMLTDVFRAWLIEANTCPSLAADSGLDMRVKCSMVSELMHMLGPVPYDVEVYEKAAEAKRQARLTGLPVPARLAAGGGGEDEAPGTPNLAAQQSFGQGAGPGGSGSGVVQPKSLHELESVDFSVLSPGELPDVVLEAEAEMARRGSWLRVFPNEEDPTRYLNLFETPRLNNMLLCKYYAQTASGARGGDAGEAFRRPGSLSSSGSRPARGAPLVGGSGGGSRPGSREWRTGGT